MPKIIPVLNLSQGQVAWALSLGQIPSKQTVDQLRYLRQVGIPFSEQELGVGRGNRMRYGYVHLVECGLALYATRRGMTPREMEKYLISQRSYLREMFQNAFLQQPDDALTAEWVKSRGRIRIMPGNDINLRMHNRYSNSPGKIEMVSMEEALREGVSPGALIERFSDDEAYLLVPVSQLVLEWMAWALEAPEFRTGPK
jgi:hypothetical protein